MDLGGWLRSLGLGQYEAAFRENAIDDTVLPNLTAEDLKDPDRKIETENRQKKTASFDVPSEQTQTSLRLPEDTETRKGESPCWSREHWLHWDSLAQWALERQRRVWLKVCT
jgi:SAM domain (Sterile alpha motif)